jgi:hypothetical protein
MRKYYVLWHCLKYKSHLGVYYNTFQKLMWINGRALDQMEYDLIHVSGIPLRIDGTGHSLLIGMKLFLIKDIVLEFPY